MGRKRGRERQEELFYASEQAEAPGHPFYEQLNRVLEAAGFDEHCEQECAKFYHAKLGRPSLAPGVLPDAADRILRRHRERTRDRVAGGG